MTKKKALLSAIAFNYPIPEDAIEKALIDSDLDAEAVYTKVDEQIIDLCAARLILGILSGATSISEGGFSISLSDREGLRSTRSFLLKKWGQSEDLEEKPKIKAISLW